MDTNNIFENVNKDEELPLDALLNSTNKDKAESTPNAKTIEKAEIIGNTATEIEKPMTALQKMKAEKEKMGAGLVLSNKELEEGAEKIPTADMINTSRRAEDYQKALDEQDEIKMKRDHLTLVHQPKDQGEYIKMMDEISSLKFDEDGKPYFEYVGYDGKLAEPYFVRIKQEGDLDFDVKTLNSENPNGAAISEDAKNESLRNNGSGVTSANVDPNAEKELEKAKTVQILIDKTGFGADFLFTEEEKEKIVEADVIKLNQVRTIDIATLKTKRSDKSFQDVIKEHNIGGSKCTICFPASGFRAQMRGLSYGEYADVSLSMDNVTFDQYYKRLSIIYNKMTNISTGPFKDFEDFLKHFAYTDIYLAIYAMFVATEQEHQEILLKCGNSQCKHTFNWKYSTRSVLRLDRCADTFLEKMKEIANADAIDFDKIRENAAVNTSHLIELPDSGFIVDMGVASAYDFLYNFIPLLNEENFKDAFGDDINEIYMNNIVLLTSIRAVHVPDGEGGYVECLGYKDILDAIYNITPNEIQILSAYTVKIQNAYEVAFSFGNVKCPHCGNITENLDISVDELVFQTYQQLMNTSVDPATIPNF